MRLPVVTTCFRLTAFMTFRPARFECIVDGLILRELSTAAWCSAFLRPARARFLHAVEAPGNVGNAVVLNTVVLCLRPAPCGQRVGHEELQREAEQRGGFQQVRRTVTHNPQHLDDCVLVACASSRHGGSCM